VSEPPEANDEYSRGSRPSERPATPHRTGTSGGSGGSAWLPPGWVLGAVLAGALLGALLLLVAEFTALYQVHTAASSTPVRTVLTGSNDSYALIPLALLSAVLGLGVFRSGSRPALLAIGIVGLVTLLIALLGDLPDSQATGLVGSPSTHFISATSTPSVGLYLETLGAVVLIATCVLGFMLLGRPQPIPPGRGGGPSRRRAGSEPDPGGPFADRPLRDRPDS